MAEGIPLKAYEFAIGTESDAFGNKPDQHATSQNADIITFSNVHFEGQCSVDNDPTSTSSDDVTFQIYNLNKDTREALMTENATLMLRAGYDTEWKRDSSGEIIRDVDTLPVIFLGGVVHSYTKKDVGSNDIITMVQCSSDQKLREMTKTSISFAPGTKKRSVIEHLVKMLNLPVIRMEIDTVGDKAYPSGLSCYDRVDNRLTTVCKECGLQFAIHNGAISILRADSQLKDQKSKDVEAWLITPDQIRELDAYFKQKSDEIKAGQTNKSNRGKKKSHKAKAKALPEDVTLSKAGGKRTRTENGVTLTTFLNGQYKIHDLVKLDGLDEIMPDGADGDLHDGLYRIINIQHQMGYPEGNWTSALKMVALS